MIYDNCPVFISHSIEQVQRRAALACTGAYRDTSHVSLLKELGWPTLSKRREYYKICRMYKLQNKISPAYMVGHLPLNRTDHVYALRNNNDIRVPLSSTIFFRNSFIPSSIQPWNAVDPSIQHCSSLSTFKRHLRNSNFPKANLLTPGRQNEPSQRQAAPLWGRRRLSEGATSRLGVNVEQVNMFVLEICIFCYFAPIIWL